MRLVRDYHLYNVVEWNGKYRGIPQWLGPVDLNLPLPDVEELGGVEGRSLAEVKRKVAAAGGIDAAYRGFPAMKLLNTIGPLNIVYYRGSFYAVRQDMGKIRAVTAAVLRRPGVWRDKSYYALLATLRSDGAIPETVAVAP
jgi:hypothetical protein